MIPLVFLTLLVLTISVSYGDAQTSDAASIQNRIEAMLDRGRDQDALALAKQWIAFAESRLGNGHEDTAIALEELCRVFKYQGRYREAEAACSRANSILEKLYGPEDRNVLIGWETLADIYYEQGRYGEAEALTSRVLAAREKTLGPEGSYVAISTLKLARIYRARGRYADAERLYKRGLAIHEKANGLDDTSVAFALHSLGLLYYQNLGRVDEAEPLLKRSLAIWEKRLGREHLYVAANLDSLAEVYAKQGRTAEAEDLFKRSLALREKRLGPNHLTVAMILRRLASFYDAHNTHYSEAEAFYKRALSINENVFGADHQGVMSPLSQLAEHYMLLGRYADAEPLLKRSLAIGEETLGPQNPDLAGVLNTLGLLELKQQHRTASHDLLRRAATIQSESELRVTPAQVRSFYNLVSAGWALSVEQSSRLEELTRESFEAAQWAVRETTGSALSQMAARFAGGSTTLAIRARERQDLVRLQESLDKTLLAAIAEAPGRRDEARIAELRRELASVEERLERLTQALEREFPTYADLTHPKPLPLGDVQRLLTPEEALVLIFPDGEDTFVWAAAHTGHSWQRVPLNNQTLLEKIAALRKGVDQEDLEKSAQAGNLFDLGLAHELYTALLGPVADLLKDKRHLLIVPSGSLTSLPFQLLVSEKPTIPKPNGKELAAYRDAAWLIKRYAISVLPSVASLKALRVLAKDGQASKPLVGYADPILSHAPGIASDQRPRQLASTGIARTRGYASYFNGTQPDLERLSERLAPLPETARELKEVAKRLNAPESDIHLGAEATEAAVKRADLSPYRVVYFATHGLVGGEVQGLAEPALVLTLPQEATDLDDGLLTASEVAQLKLNADWVVLSACNTAAGDKPGAEALSGLARAFFYAGARALLVSHWRVDSDAAARLTVSTFEALQKDPTIGRAEALRRAMLAYLNDTLNPWNAYPDYWAPFSVIGEGGARR